MIKRNQLDNNLGYTLFGDIYEKLHGIAVSKVGRKLTEDIWKNCAGGLETDIQEAIEDQNDS